MPDVVVEELDTSGGFGFEYYVIDRDGERLFVRQADVEFIPDA